MKKPQIAFGDDERIRTFVEALEHDEATALQTDLWHLRGSPAGFSPVAYLMLRALHARLVEPHMSRGAAAGE